MSRVSFFVAVFAALLVLAAAQSTSSSSSTGSASSSSGGSSQNTVTFCSNYTQILFGNNTGLSQQNLISAIVTRAAIGSTTSNPNVQGLFSSASSNPLYNIFSGKTQYRAGAPDYTNSSKQDQGLLAAKLVAYFGALFGCNSAGFPSIASANGVTNMYTVHANMNITSSMEDYFNAQIANTLTSFGVDGAVLANQGVPALKSFYQCAPPLAFAPTSPVQICGAYGCGYGQTGSLASCAQYYYNPSSTGGYQSGSAAAQYGASSLLVLALAVIAALFQ